MPLDPKRLEALRLEAESYGPTNRRDRVFAPHDMLQLLDDLEEATRMWNAYKKAKAENDERFMIERDEARAQRDEFANRAEALQEALNTSQGERDELQAEVYAFQGRPGGALPGWAFVNGAWVRDLGPVPGSSSVPPTRQVLMVVREGARFEWRLCTMRGENEFSRPGIGFADMPRVAMRAAEAAARKVGWKA